MLRKVKFFGIVILVLIIGLTMSSCPEPEDDHEHSWGEWARTLGPTCTVAGTDTRSCSCGEKETRSVPALGHEASDRLGDGTVGTSCLSPISGNFQCVRWGVCQTLVPALNVYGPHVYTNYSTVREATCTVNGEASAPCDRSAAHPQGTRPIPAPGHDLPSESVRQRCFTDGVGTGVCTKCSLEITNTIPAFNEHVFPPNPDSISYAPNCIANGWELVDCMRKGQDRCSGFTINEAIRIGSKEYVGKNMNMNSAGVAQNPPNVILALRIDPLGHAYTWKFDVTYSSGVPTVDPRPSCVEPGTESGTCLRCTNPTTRTIPPGGHVHITGTYFNTKRYYIFTDDDDYIDTNATGHYGIGYWESVIEGSCNRVGDIHVQPAVIGYRCQRAQIPNNDENQYNSPPGTVAYNSAQERIKPCSRENKPTDPDPGNGTGVIYTETLGVRYHDWNWGGGRTNQGMTGGPAYKADNGEEARECQYLPVDVSNPNHLYVNCVEEAGIGDIGPQGGIIFYKGAFYNYLDGSDIPPSTPRSFYLEAALKNETVSLPWSTKDQYGNSPSFSTEAKANLVRQIEIGSGRRNTKLILETEAPNITTIAAGARNALGGESTGWALPSDKEMEHLFVQRDVVGLTEGWYWTSTNYDLNTAYAADVPLKGSSYKYDSKPINKSMPLNVRLVRAF